MEHSLYAYLTRRTQEELQSVIAMCKAELPSAYYEDILAMAERILQEKASGKNQNKLGEQ